MSAVVLTLLLWDRGTRAADRFSFTHDEARAAFAGFELPAGYTLAGEEELGVSSCLFADCLRVERYYASLRTVETACDDLFRAISAWGVSGISDAGGCNYSGRLSRWRIQAQVLADADIDSYGTSRDRPITEPHESVAIVTVSRP